MMHLDIEVDDLAAAVDNAVELGTRFACTSTSRTRPCQPMYS